MLPLARGYFDEETRIMLKVDGPRLEEQLRLHQRDTGSADVQAALLTRRINRLTEHLREHRKDHSCRRGLIKLVSDRRRLLDYLRDVTFERYQNAREKLQLRK
jgi:small subunit ribosomal protein S15